MEDIEDQLERDDMGAYHRRVEAALGCWNPATAHSFASNHRSKVPCPPDSSLPSLNIRNVSFPFYEKTKFQ